MPPPRSAAARAAAPRPEIPSPPRLRSLGEILRIRNDMLGVVDRRFREFGPVVHQRNGVMDLVSLFGPDANRLVLLDRDRIFSAKRAWDMIMGRIFTNGLLLRDGEDHRHHRKIMQGAFQTAALRGYLERMNPHVGRVLDRWAARGTRFEAFPALKSLTLDLAARIFLGLELGDEVDDLNEDFESAVAASMSLVRLPIPGLEFHRGLQGRRHMIEFFGRLVPERRAGGGDDMLSRLCRAQGEGGKRFDDAEIIDHVIFLMMAAHDTTTSTLSSLLYELARHPEWQERVREECLGFGRDHLEYEDLLGVPELTKAMNETLRRYPPLSTIPRVATRSFEFGGYEIPEGVMVAIFPIHTHHMPEWWTTPFQFDPERFSPGRSEHQRRSHLFVPFGGGSHMCLGLRFAEMQIKAVVFQLVQRYRWSVDRDYEMPVQQAPISKPRDGLPLRIERIAG